jgi:hypothetical protein
MKTTKTTPNANFNAKVQIILSQNVEGQQVYRHAITLDDNFEGKTFGMVVGALAHRFYRTITMTKMNGNGKRKIFRSYEENWLTKELVEKTLKEHTAEKNLPKKA